MNRRKSCDLSFQKKTPLAFSCIERVLCIRAIHLRGERGTETREGGSVAACSLGSRLGPSAGPAAPVALQQHRLLRPLGGPQTALGWPLPSVLTCVFRSHLQSSTLSTGGLLECTNRKKIHKHLFYTGAQCLSIFAYFSRTGEKEVSGFINHDKREPSSSEGKNKILSYPYSPGNHVSGLHLREGKATTGHWPRTLIYGGHSHVSRRKGRPLEKAAGSPPRA